MTQTLSSYYSCGVKYKHVAMIGSIFLLPRFVGDANLEDGYGTKYFKSKEELVSKFPIPSDVNDDAKGTVI